MGKRKYLSNFDKSQAVMGRGFSKTAALVGLYPVCTGQYLSKVVQGRKSGSLMHTGSEGRPVWSDPTDELLWPKMLKNRF